MVDNEGEMRNRVRNEGPSTDSVPVAALQNAGTGNEADAGLASQLPPEKIASPLHGNTSTAANQGTPHLNRNILIGGSGPDSGIDGPGPRTLTFEDPWRQLRGDSGQTSLQRRASTGLTETASTAPRRLRLAKTSVWNRLIKIWFSQRSTREKMKLSYLTFSPNLGRNSVRVPFKF